MFPPSLLPLQRTIEHSIVMPGRLWTPPSQRRGAAETPGLFDRRTNVVVESIEQTDISWPRCKHLERRLAKSTLDDSKDMFLCPGPSLASPGQRRAQAAAADRTAAADAGPPKPGRVHRRTMPSEPLLPIFWRPRGVLLHWKLFPRPAGVRITPLRLLLNPTRRDALRFVSSRLILLGLRLECEAL